MYYSRLQFVHNNVTIIFSYLRVQFWGQSLWILWVEWEIIIPRVIFPGPSVSHLQLHIQINGKSLSESRSEWAKTQWKVGTLLSQAPCMQEGSARYIHARWDSSRAKCTGKISPNWAPQMGRQVSLESKDIEGRDQEPLRSLYLPDNKLDREWQRNYLWLGQPRILASWDSGNFPALVHN